MTTRGLWWTLVIALAALLRLPGLGGPPLSEREAASAWTAATTARGESPPALAEPPASALLLSSQTFAFWFVDRPSAVVARAPAAIAGVAAVAAAGLLGPWIGGTGALVLGFLVAVEPGWVAASRSGDGAMLAAACALFALGALARIGAADDAGSRAWLAGFGGAAGALATAGPLAWDLLAGLAAALAATAWPSARASGRRLLRYAGASALLAGTTGLAQWTAVASVGESLRLWLGSWAAPRAETATELPVTALPLLVVAVAGLAGARGALRPRRAFLVAIVAWSALSLLRPAPLEHAWLVASLPLLIAAAGAAGPRLETVTQLSGRRRVPARLVTAALAALLLVPGARAGVAGAAGRSRSSDAWMDLLAADLRALQSARAEDASVRRLEVVADPWPDPLLGWSLVDVAGVREVRSPSLATSAERLVLARLGDEAVLRGSDDRILGRYRLPERR